MIILRMEALGRIFALCQFCATVLLGQTGNQRLTLSTQYWQASQVAD